MYMYIFFLRTLSEIYMKNSVDCIWTLNKEYHKYYFQLFLGRDYASFTYSMRPLVFQIRTRLLTH